MGLLVDVLRGTHSPEVQQRGLERVKTFGAGADVGAFSWAMFIQQFIQHGLLEIDYTDHYHLKITPLGDRVLKGMHAVRLVTPDTIKERQERAKKTVVPRAAAPSVNADLLTALKALRKSVATEIGKPAFVVFSDATLIDMASKKPTNIYEFRLVNGVGDHKAKLYAALFLKAIKEF
jgi:ATP-dependent DNA helicase RecQ